MAPREQIDLFMKRGTELWNSRVRYEGLNVSINMKWSADEEMLKVNTKEPDLEDFRSFLTIFRKFISQDSAIFLPKIYNICYQHITDKECKKVLTEAREVWQELQTQSGIYMTLTINNRQLSPKDVVDIWINGHYFHDDVEGMRLLESLEPYQLAAARVIFIDYVIEVTKIIKHLGENIHVAMNRGWFNF